MKRDCAVTILGGTGFGAGELLRLLIAHPAAEVVSVVSSSSAGTAISEAHPHLRSFYDTPFDESFSFEKLSGYGSRIIFAALPHGSSSETVAPLYADAVRHGVKIIDLSGDFRLNDSALHEKWYPSSALAPEVRSHFQYGLTELFREKISASHAIANPGCLATASILAVAPLVSAHAPIHIALNLTTGSSGAGREPKATTHHPIRHSNLSAYKPLSHQHMPEIEQALGAIAGRGVTFSFVPHSIPVSRGIFATAYVKLSSPVTEEEIRKLYRGYFEKSPFVRVLASGSPELQNVVGSNFTDICVSASGTEVVVMAALDNLVKGMAGQAIQNMNLMCGFPETTGLWFPAPRPL